MKIKLKIIWIIIFINLEISELAKSNSKNFQLEFFEISAFNLKRCRQQRFLGLNWQKLSRNKTTRLKIISQRDLRLKLK